MSEQGSSAIPRVMQPDAVQGQDIDTYVGNQVADSLSIAGNTETQLPPVSAPAPGNIQRHLESGKLHSAQAQKLVMRAASLYGNKATRQIVQRSLASSKPKTPTQPQRQASGVVQRDLLGGVTNFINTGNFSLPTSLPSTPSFSNTTSNLGVTNVGNDFKPPANKDFTGIVDNSGKPGIPKDLTGIVDNSGKPGIPKDFTGIVDNLGKPGIPKDLTGIGDPFIGKPPGDKDFTQLPRLIPFEQLPPLPPGTQGVTVPPNVTGTPEFGTVIGPDGKPQYLIVLAPQGLNGNPRGTLLSLDATQVINPGGTSGSPAPITIPDTGITPVTTPTGVGNTGPVTIQGYDPGTVLSQLPTGASIRLFNSGIEAQTQIVPVANGLPASAVGVVVGTGGKEKGYVTLREVDGIPAGTVFSIKFPQQQIGSIRPGATDNPFKPVAPPVPTPVSTVPSQSGGLFEGDVTDVPTPIGANDGEAVAAKPKPPSPSPNPSPTPSPNSGGGSGSLWDKLGDTLKNVFGGGDKKPEEKPAPTNRSSEADFYRGLAEAIKAAGANGKYPVEVTVSGQSIIVDTNGNIKLDAPIPGVPVTGGVGVGNTVDIQGRQVILKPITNVSPPSSNPGSANNTSVPAIRPPFGMSWQDSNANAIQNSVPNNVRATLNFSAGATIPTTVIQQGVQGGWIRLMDTVDARGVQKPTYVLRDGQQFILIRNGQVANIAPIGGVKLLPR
jgi:hypothetical protein